VFAGFEETALAAASLAQVHGATLADGTRVAVKVQVPGVEDTVEVDLTALRILAQALRDVLPQIDLPTIADELSRSVVAELDYLDEAAHGEAVRRDFAGDADVLVPHVHRELSTSRLLVLERVDGQRLVEFLDGCETRGDAAGRDAVLGTLVRVYCAQLLAHGRFQADAHPGNFLVVPGSDGGRPRLALLDFGCTVELAPEVRRAWAGLTAAIVAGDGARTAQLLVALGFATSDGNTAPLVEFAEMLMGAFRRGADLGAIDPRAQIEQAMAAARANPVVRIPRDFVLIGRVLASVGGLLMRYRPRLDLFSTILPYLAAAAA
jgi:predicted unusual protein kinase regulating ubiquinone biosynthesis (AarF/ABC1/UbiB family)